MDNFLQVVLNSLQELTALDFTLLTFNVVLFFFARPILQKVSSENTQDAVFVSRLKFFRAINGLIFMFILAEDIFLPIAKHSWLTKIIALPLIVYTIYLSYFVLKYLIKKRFGRVKETNGSKVIVDTYNSHLLSLLAGVFMMILGLVATIQLLGFESMLRAGGVVGFMGVMLALTQAAWAPDIISGLIILNSEEFNDGDIIQFYDTKPVIGSVFKVKLFYTEILNLANNHRIMIKNSKLRDYTIHNLSRFSSAKGLREELQFNIGYEVQKAQVEKIFNDAAKDVCENPDVAVDSKYPIEVRATDAGDFAITWSVFYHTKKVHQLLKTRQAFRCAVITAAHDADISLATPVMHTNIGISCKDVKSKKASSS
jgi:hypothetical protein